MANNLQFTTPISVPNIRTAKVTRVTELDEDGKRMVVEVQLAGVGGVQFEPIPWRLEITNGSIDGLAAHPAPPIATHAMISIRLASGGGTATAFDTCLTAYRAAGSDKRGNLMVAMQGISGLVSGGPLNATTQPALPPGTVS